MDGRGHGVVEDKPRVERAQPHAVLEPPAGVSGEGRKKRTWKVVRVFNYMP